MKLGYCGLNCSQCAVYLATISNSEKERIKLAREYSTDTCVFSKEDMSCLGCHSDSKSEKMCGACEIRKCGLKQTCNNCSECEHFPCSILDENLGNHSDSMNYLKQLWTEYKNK